MGNGFYSLTVLLVLIWGVAYFGFLYAGIVHILLILALVSLVVGIRKQRQ